MLKLKDNIIIVPPLSGLNEIPESLIYRKGIVAGLCYDRNGAVRGAWIKLLGKPYLDEQEWYIPINQINYDYTKKR